MQIEGLNARLDKFIIAQNSIQAEQVQQEDIIFKGIVQNTAGLSGILKADQDASQEYKKVNVYQFVYIPYIVILIDILLYVPKVILKYF